MSTLSDEQLVNLIKDLNTETMGDLVIEVCSQLVENGVDRQVIIDRIKREII